MSTYHAAKTWAPDAPFVRLEYDEVLTAREWLAWFRGCLNAKINRGLDILDDDTMGAIEDDRRQVEAYYHQRIRHYGCRNLLATQYMRKRFPEVNNQAKEA
jgi:hypothetical protein